MQVYSSATRRAQAAMMIGPRLHGGFASATGLAAYRVYFALCLI